MSTSTKNREKKTDKTGVVLSVGKNKIPQKVWLNMQEANKNWRKKCEKQKKQKKKIGDSWNKKKKICTNLFQPMASVTYTQNVKYVVLNNMINGKKMLENPVQV